MTRRPSLIRCGNAVPLDQMPPQTRAVIAWFGSFLEWSAADPATRGERPAEVDPLDYDRHGEPIPDETRREGENGAAPN